MEKDINEQITELKNLILKDQTELEKTVGQIRKFQEKKKNLEARLRENRHLLENLENRKVANTVEGAIGKLDDHKLALLAKFLEAYGGEIDDGKDDVGDERAESRDPDVAG